LTDYRANDPKAVGARKDREKDAREQQQLDLKALLAIPEFRRFVWRHMFVTCQLMTNPSSTNGSLQSLQIGKQDVAREMWAEIEAVEPLVIPQMMREHHEAQK
jgi:hypothetical protein